MYWRVDLRSPDDRVLASKGFPERVDAHVYAKELRKRLRGDQTVHVVRNPAEGGPAPDVRAAADAALAVMHCYAEVFPGDNRILRCIGAAYSRLRGQISERAAHAFLPDAAEVLRVAERKLAAQPSDRRLYAAYWAAVAAHAALVAATRGGARPVRVATEAAAQAAKAYAGEPVANPARAASARRNPDASDFIEECLDAAADARLGKGHWYHRDADDLIPKGWALSPALPQRNTYETDLLGASNQAAVAEILDGLEARESDVHDGTLGDDFDRIRANHSDYVVFRPWDVDEENGDRLASEIGTALAEDVFSPLESYPILDEDDLSRREMEDTEENFRDEGSRFVRDDAPEGWVGQVLTYMSEHDEYSSNLDSRDGGGGYPDEDDLLEVMHELKLLSPETEAEYFTDVTVGEPDIHTRYIGPVTVEMNFHKNTDGGWNEVVDGVIRLRHGNRTLSMRFAPVKVKFRLGYHAGRPAAASAIAADVVSQARSQKTNPAFADALMEVLGDDKYDFEMTDENDKVYREWTSRWEPRHLRENLTWVAENPRRRR